MEDPISELDECGHSQVIKAALHYSVGQMIEEVGKEYELIYTKPLIATFAEFINRQIEIYATDLEAFAKHANRSLIKCSDVKLLVRRNADMKNILESLSDSIEASSIAMKQSEKRKRNLTTKEPPTEASKES